MAVSLKSNDRIFIRTKEGMRFCISQLEEFITINALPALKSTTPPLINIHQESPTQVSIKFKMPKERKAVPKLRAAGRKKKGDK